MHLLAATPGQIDDGSEAIDLGQTPADIVYISAADTELAALSEAHTDLNSNTSLRLANLTHLSHPMSVDLHIDDCASKSKVVIARILGGTGYWKYGIEQYAARLGAAGIKFIALPGDDKPDEELWEFSTIIRKDWEALWAYMVEGGLENSRNFLLYINAILQNSDKPEPAKPLLKAGLYWPGTGITDMHEIQKKWHGNAGVVPIIFYRALVQGAGLHPINRMIKALLKRGLNPMPIFVASLKDPLSVATLESLFNLAPPDVILNCTSFAVGSPDQSVENSGTINPLTMEATQRAPVFQVVFSSSSESVWENELNGLNARDIAMNVALPEVDGRVLTRAISFKGEAFFDEKTQCPIGSYRARGDRIEYVADLTKNWVTLRHTNAQTKKVSLILANYPNKDGRLANGVGLDTPQATVDMMKMLKHEGYHTKDLPHSSDELMKKIMNGPTNWLTDRAIRSGGKMMPLEDYLNHYKKLPLNVRDKIEDRWGKVEDDPFFGNNGFALSVFEFGNICVGIQPARGYNINPKETYHSPDLIPPHNYLAFYFWLRFSFKTNAFVHMGKHGNLEWLPGKAIALSNECLPEVIIGPTPNAYPFIVNDPGEGTQAKRRISAVIVDHLTPPLTRAETYGPLRELETLVDEYYEAAGIDPRRLKFLKDAILSLTSATGIDLDAGMAGENQENDLAKLDEYLCELKEAQIRDGLHIFGTSPTGRLERDLSIALARVPRGDGKGENASLQRALAIDLKMDFDPLDCPLGQTYNGNKPKILHDICEDVWRTNGDAIERIELLAIKLLDGTSPGNWPKTKIVLNTIQNIIRPIVAICGLNERKGLIDTLNGLFIAPAPSGAPTRGRLDVLPTGRNFFSVDSRAIPTPTAWALGWKSANLLIEKHLQDHGDWPKTILLTAWGTANMRTGGDDIAQALALMGVKPKWDTSNRRVIGFEIMPTSVLDRPRVDVTLRVSGFFRDAFPQQMALVDSAARAIMKLDEPASVNPAAHKFKNEGHEDSAYRVFGSKPGSYGAGLQAMIDEKLWSNKADLAESYLEWGSYAYGKSSQGKPARVALETRLSQVDAIVQNQDNREHDILDSDDYYQFEGGAAAAISTIQGRDQPIYHNDHSRPERPIIRTLDEEIGRVMHSRVVNPKWIEGIKRHGYKGAFEMAATLDYLFAFSATTGAVQNHHFDMIEAAFIGDEETRTFIHEHNPSALLEMAERFKEAVDRKMWIPKSNSVHIRIENILKSISKKI